MADSKIFVVAPTKAVYDEYYHRTFDWDKHDRSTFYWVRDVDSVRGHRNPSGVFVGDWRNMTNIVEIIDSLQICWNFQNKALIKIREELTNTNFKKTNLIVTLNGVVQQPSEYTATYDTLTLVNPSNEMVNFNVKHRVIGQLAQGSILPNGTISIAL